MSSPTLALAAALCFAAALPAIAADNEAGVPLAPGDAAGPWTLQSAGHTICVVHLSDQKTPAGFGMSASPQCGAALPQGASGWRPTHDGLAFTGADGQEVMSFGRWSNSLFVSHRSSAEDVQLKRGMPGPNY
ncbi:MAG TPA: AprI/Inh family metalloprotease inhibitor [Caulobacteraceae bacterium]